MKLGNISQTIVPVPNFFLYTKTRNIETFNLYNITDTNYSNFEKRHNKRPISLKKNYKTQLDIDNPSLNNKSYLPKFSRKRKNIFKDKDILTQLYDINYNNNPRKYMEKDLQQNREKYIPIYHTRKYPNLTKIKKSYFPGIVGLNNTDYNLQEEKSPKSKIALKTIQKFRNYEKYKKDIHIENFLSPDLREEIKNNTKNLIDRINMNYDIDRWNEFNSRNTFNRFFQTAYSPLNDVIKSSKGIKDQFTDTLREKALGLRTINNKSKISLENSIYKEIELQKQNSEENYETYLDELITTHRDNLLKLKTNNEPAPKYSSRDKLFIHENKYITKSLNKTKLYEKFPSKTREEFNVKKIIKHKSLNRNKNIKGNIQLKDKYGTVESFNKNKEDNYLELMWKRPLHKDAYKLHE